MKTQSIISQESNSYRIEKIEKVNKLKTNKENLSNKNFYQSFENALYYVEEKNRKVQNDSTILKLAIDKSEKTLQSLTIIRDYIIDASTNESLSDKKILQQKINQIIADIDKNNVETNYDDKLPTQLNNTLHDKNKFSLTSSLSNILTITGYENLEQLNNDLSSKSLGLTNKEGKPLIDINNHDTTLKSLIAINKAILSVKGTNSNIHDFLFLNSIEADSSINEDSSTNHIPNQLDLNNTEDFNLYRLSNYSALSLL